MLLPLTAFFGFGVGADSEGAAVVSFVAAGDSEPDEGSVSSAVAGSSRRSVVTGATSVGSESVGSRGTKVKTAAADAEARRPLEVKAAAKPLAGPHPVANQRQQTDAHAAGYLRQVFVFLCILAYFGNWASPSYVGRTFALPRNCTN